MNAWREVLDRAPDGVEEMVRKSYEGELIGIAMFTSLAERAPTESERRAYEALRTVEETLTTYFAPELVEALDVDRDAARAKAQAFAADWAGQTWRENCASVLPEAQVSLDEFYWLAERVDSSLAPIAEVLVLHEERLIEFFTVNSTSDEPSLDIVTNLLRRIGA